MFILVSPSADVILVSTDNQCEVSGETETSSSSLGETSLNHELSSGDLFSKGLYSVTYTITDQADNERVRVFYIQVCEGMAIIC